MWKAFLKLVSIYLIMQEDHSHLMDSSTGTITETGPDFTQDGKAEQPVS